MAAQPQITLYWHDYETWGEIPAVDRPSQFAGVRTDQDLNIIGEPLMIYAQPAPDLLPKPEACLVTGLLPQQAAVRGLKEAEFIAAIYRELAQPGTCGVGYNSIRFDDEVTRYCLYRNFYDPYEREWRNGNSRWDIIDMVRMARALRPEGIVWPHYEDGRPSFKLEMLTAANGLNHEAAHDALSDVYATIALARLIKERQPKLYDYAFQLRDKRFASSLIDIDSAKPLLHISSRFPSQQANCALVLPLAMHPNNRNSVIAFNLDQSPQMLLSLDVNELRQRLFTAASELPEGIERLALKEVHLNKTPMLLPPNMLDEQACERLQIDRAKVNAHWRQLADLSLIEKQALRAKLAEIYAENSFPERQDPEQQLYAGFINDEDKRLMYQVRRSTPEELASSSLKFLDKRLQEMLFRYRARNFPESLSVEEMACWRQFCYSRLTDPAQGAGLVWEEFQQRIQQLLATDLSEVQKSLMIELLAYGQSLLARVAPA